jgi:hypothetical protein
MSDSALSIGGAVPRWRRSCRWCRCERFRLSEGSSMSDRAPLDAFRRPETGRPTFFEFADEDRSHQAPLDSGRGPEPGPGSGPEG